jgi:hypothetical protein
MKRIAYLSLLIFCAFPIMGLAQDIKKDLPKSFTVRVQNPLKQDRESVFVHISESALSPIKDFNPKAFGVWDGKNEVPAQFNHSDADSKGIVLILDQMKSSATTVLTVRYHPSGEWKGNYTKRTQAELSHKFGGEWKNREYIGGDFKNVEELHVPKEHKDHSWFIRYEGPGWESDRVGYRFYLDQRNATDVFGKLTPEPILQKVGLDGFDSYHNMQEWGMDVMKVGKSLGVGSIGRWQEKGAIRVEHTDSLYARILENGDVYSSVLTKYHGWQAGVVKTSIDSRISIHAGTRLTRQQLTFSNKSMPDIATGIVKDKKAPELLKSTDNSNEWAWIATWGMQSLNNDQLGFAVFYRKSDFLGFEEDTFSHVVKLKPSNGEITYYFEGAWEKEPGGITTQEAFVKYLNHTAAELSSPVRVTVNKK